MKQISTTILSLMFIFSSILVLLPSSHSVLAHHRTMDDCDEIRNQEGESFDWNVCVEHVLQSEQDDCPDGYVRVAVPIERDDGVDPHCIPRGDTIEDNAIIVYLRGVVRFLAVGVGIITALMIVISGIQYIGSAGNPQGIESAKKKLLHAVEALLLFIFMAAILNYVIPGGIF